MLQPYAAGRIIGDALVISYLELFIITVAMSAGAGVQASVGYGMALVASPVLVLINPNLIPGPMLISAFTLSILVLIRERGVINFQGLQWAIAGRVLGGLIAAWLITVVTQDVFVLIFGFLVIIAVVISAIGFTVPLNKRNLTIAGTLAGIMGTIASLGGPPIAMVYQHEAGARIRTSLSGFFIAGTLISMVVLGAVGKFGAEEFRYGLFLLPGTLVGFVLSKSLLRWLDGKYTRTAILLVATVSALVVIIRQLFYLL